MLISMLDVMGDTKKHQTWSLTSAAHNLDEHLEDNQALLTLKGRDGTMQVVRVRKSLMKKEEL